MCCQPRLILFITVDQQLYAISKKVPWTLPHAYGEDNHVVLVGEGGGGGGREATHRNGNVSSNWRLAWWEWLDIGHDNSW